MSPSSATTTTPASWEALPQSRRRHLRVRRAAAPGGLSGLLFFIAAADIIEVGFGERVEEGEQERGTTTDTPMPDVKAVVLLDGGSGGSVAAHANVDRDEQGREQGHGHVEHAAAQTHHHSNSEDPEKTNKSDDVTTTTTTTTTTEWLDVKAVVLLGKSGHMIHSNDTTSTGSSPKVALMSDPNGGDGGLGAGAAGTAPSAAKDASASGGGGSDNSGGAKDANSNVEAVAGSPPDKGASEGAAAALGASAGAAKGAAADATKEEDGDKNAGEDSSRANLEAVEMNQIADASKSISRVHHALGEAVGSEGRKAASEAKEAVSRSGATPGASTPRIVAVAFLSVSAAALSVASAAAF